MNEAQIYLLDSNGYVNAPLKDYSFLVGGRLGFQYGKRTFTNSAKPF
jgi:hypothetical protein